MSILNAPDDLFPPGTEVPDVSIHQYYTDKTSERGKIQLTKNVISMLLEGKKQLHIKNQSIELDNKNIILISNGNCLMREMVEDAVPYRSLLLFFSNTEIENVLFESGITPSIYLNRAVKPQNGFYVIKKDAHLQSLISKFNAQLQSPTYYELKENFKTTLKYLIDREGDGFIAFLCSIVYGVDDTIFKRVVESNRFSNLGLEELSFLCNMSLSSFKRHFVMKYGESPGKWFLKNRMTKAKELLEKKVAKPSDIYSQFGYENLSNFSAAFKNVFGYSPSKVSA
ncbi:MAG: AraC family transcriptional regulator [Flavobacteriales bacterium]